MSERANPADLLRSFLRKVKFLKGDLNDPFTTQSRVQATSVRIHGIVKQLVEDEEAITRNYAAKRGAALSSAASRGLANSSTYFNELASLFHQEEFERLKDRGHWFS